MRINSSAWFIKIMPIQDKSTGLLVNKVISKKRILARKEPVGMQTFWQAQVSSTFLDFTFVVKSRMYNGENYVYDGKELYEVFNLAKGKTAEDTKLNVKRNKDAKILALVKSEIKIGDDDE